MGVVVLMGLDFFILPIALFLDAQIRFVGWGVSWPLQSCFLFLFFIFAKRSSRQSVLVFLFFLCLSHFFSATPFTPLFLGYGLVMVLIQFVKKRIILETFVIEALWASGLFALLIVTQGLITDAQGFLWLIRNKSVPLLFYILLHFALAFFVLIALHRLYRRFLDPRKAS